MFFGFAFTFSVFRFSVKLPSISRFSVRRQNSGNITCFCYCCCCPFVQIINVHKESHQVCAVVQQRLHRQYLPIEVGNATATARPRTWSSAMHLCACSSATAPRWSLLPHAHVGHPHVGHACVLVLHELHNRSRLFAEFEKSVKIEPICEKFVFSCIEL